MCVRVKCWVEGCDCHAVSVVRNVFELFEGGPKVIDRLAVCLEHTPKTLKSYSVLESLTYETLRLLTPIEADTP